MFLVNMSLPIFGSLNIQNWKVNLGLFINSFCALLKDCTVQMPTLLGLKKFFSEICRCNGWWYSRLSATPYN